MSQGRCPHQPAVSIAEGPMRASAPAGAYKNASGMIQRRIIAVPLCFVALALTRPHGVSPPLPDALPRGPCRARFQPMAGALCRSPLRVLFPFPADIQLTELFYQIFLVLSMAFFNGMYKMRICMFNQILSRRMSTIYVFHYSSIDFKFLFLSSTHKP